MLGNAPLPLTSSTLPTSGAVSRGEAAVASPTTVLTGQFPATKLACSQGSPKKTVTFGLRSGGTLTTALIRPASSASWRIEVLTVVGTPFVVCPGPPISAVNAGEKSRFSQPVVVKLACPLAGEPEWGTAEKLVVCCLHEVGLRMNGLPVPGAIPNSVMSCELMVVSNPDVEFGMLLMIVLSP